jgi:hypothetical protein
MSRIHPADPTDPVAEAIRQLYGAGWSVGIVPFAERHGGRAWLVIGRKDATRPAGRPGWRRGVMRWPRPGPWGGPRSRSPNPGGSWSRPWS